MSAVAEVVTTKSEDLAEFVVEVVAGEMSVSVVAEVAAQVSAVAEVIVVWC